MLLLGDMSTPQAHDPEQLRVIWVICPSPIELPLAERKEIKMNVHTFLLPYVVSLAKRAAESFICFDIVIRHQLH